MACSKLKRIGEFTINTENELGRGNFGAVFMGEHYETKETVVAKKLFLDRMPGKEYATSEVEILKLGVDHKNIVQILFHLEGDSEFWIIMEYCDKGNLSAYAKHNQMDLYFKIDVVHQCSNALVYLLNLKPKRVIHRDLKPPNILLLSSQDEDGIVAKLSDFGISKAIDSSESTKLGTIAGSKHFMAPEIFDEDVESYNRAVDVFSLGIIIHYLLKVKYGDDMDSKKFLGQAIGMTMCVKKEDGEVKILDTDDEQVKEVKKLLKQMILLNPKNRISVEKVCEKLEQIKLRMRPKESSSSDEESSSSAKPAEGHTRSRFVARMKRVLSMQFLTSSSLALHKRSSLDLSFNANFRIGMGEKCLILEDATNNKLVKVTTAEREKLTEEWSKDLPPGFKSDSHIHVMDSSLISQNGKGDPVVTYDVCDLTHQRTYPKPSQNRLCAALPRGQILYVKETSSNAFDVEVYSLPRHKYITTLSPPQQYESDCISACCHPASHNLAVLDPSSHCLDIYNSHFGHQTRVQLSYDPGWINAVCAVKDCIVITDNHCVYVYNWKGKGVIALTHEQLGVEDRYVHGIGRTVDDCVVLATGDDYVKSLYLYEID